MKAQRLRARYKARCIAVLGLLALPAMLRSQIPLQLHGTVVDTTGAAIPGAPVRLETNQGVLIAGAHADSSGNFSLLDPSPGNVRLVVSAYLGFAPSSLSLHVTSPVSGVKVVLKLQSVNQEIAVSADQAGSTEASANRDTISVTSSELLKVPVFDQDPIATLTPFLDASSGSSGGVTLIVDGVEVNSLGISASAIQEIRINNDPYSAEFNRPGRGRIEITSKPGSPEFHGELNFTFRDAVLNAKNHFATVRPPESRRIYEGHLAGPVGYGGHTSFIVSGSRREEDTASIVNAIGLTGLIQDNVLTPDRNMQFSSRINHDFSTDHRLSIGYNFQNYTNVNAGVGGIVLREAGYNTNNREDDVTVNDRLIVNTHLINQLQMQLERQDDNTQSVTNAQSIQVSGSFIGGGAQADVHRSENTMHVNEVLSWTHGRQYVRAGVQLPQFSRRAVDDRTDRLGTFRFSSPASYAAALAFVFTAQQGPGRALYWINEFGSFLQDEIAINQKLQLVLGLRYDWQTFLPDNNNLAPRVSLAYAPGKGGTVLRLGSGVFYDRTGGDFPATVKLHDGVTLHAVQLQNPSFPLPSNANYAALPTNLVRFDPNVRAPYAIQYSAGIERQIRKAFTLTVGYRGQVQIKSFRSRDANAPLLPPNPSLGTDYTRPDPDFGQIQQIESGGRSLLNALDLSFRGQAGQWFSGQAQYTLSRFENNTGGINWFPQDQYRPNAEWGRADQDRLSRFNLLGNIHPGHWLSLGVAATLYSGAPYTETTGTDDYHTGLANARPAGVRRNTLNTSGVASLDLLYSHDFRLTKASGDHAKVLSPGISAFNVLNRTNYTGFIGALTSPFFGQPTAALPARQLQLALGYRF